MLFISNPFWILARDRVLKNTYPGINASIVEKMAIVVKGQTEFRFSDWESNESRQRVILSHCNSWFFRHSL
jgi:hypothetical protein